MNEENHNRVFVSNDPINFIDPEGKSLLGVAAIVAPPLVVIGTAVAVGYLINKKAKKLSVCEKNDRMQNSESLEDFLRAKGDFDEARNVLINSPEVQAAPIVLDAAMRTSPGPSPTKINP